MSHTSITLKPTLKNTLFLKKKKKAKPLDQGAALKIRKSWRKFDILEINANENTTYEIIYDTATVNCQVVKLDLEKAEEPEIKLPTSVGS